MGRSKALLEFSGIKLVERALETLRRAGLDEAWVSGEIPGMPCFPDVTKGLGPLGGLHTAAERFPGSRILAIPVDMPALGASTLQGLVDRAALSGAPAAAFEGFELPVVFSSTLRARAVLRELCFGTLDSRERSVAHFSARMEVSRLPVPCDCMREFTNINTPREWEEFVK